MKLFVTTARRLIARIKRNQVEGKGKNNNQTNITLPPPFRPTSMSSSVRRAHNGCEDVRRAHNGCEDVVEDDVPSLFARVRHTLRCVACGECCGEDTAQEIKYETPGDRAMVDPTISSTPFDSVVVPNNSKRRGSHQLPPDARFGPTSAPAIAVPVVSPPHPHPHPYGNHHYGRQSPPKPRPLRSPARGGPIIQVPSSSPPPRQKSPGTSAAMRLGLYDASASKTSAKMLSV